MGAEVDLVIPVLVMSQCASAAVTFRGGDLIAMERLRATHRTEPIEILH